MWSLGLHSTVACRPSSAIGLSCPEKVCHAIADSLPRADVSSSCAVGPDLHFTKHPGKPNVAEVQGLCRLHLQKNILLVGAGIEAYICLAHSFSLYYLGARESLALRCWPVTVAWNSSPAQNPGQESALSCEAQASKQSPAQVVNVFALRLGFIFR